VKARLLDNLAERKTFVVVFEEGDEPVTGLTDLAKREGVSGAHLTGIGAFSSVTLGFFDRTRRDYRKTRVEEPVEVVSLVGNIALDKDSPKLHAHVVVARANGQALGGHLLEAKVGPTLEVVIEESPQQLHRTFDEATGLALIDLGGR
jgi:uncharacterized protein